MVKKLLSNSLFNSSAIYTFSSIINSSLPFLFLPILTRTLEPSEYGIIAMFNISVSVVYAFVGLNLEAAIARKYYEEDSNFSFFVGTSTILSTVSAIVLSFVFWCKSEFLSILTQIPEGYIIFISLLAYFRFLMLALLTVFQVQSKALNYGFFQILHSILNISLTLYMLFVMELSWQSRVFGQLIAGLLLAIISFCVLRKNNFLKFKVFNSDLNYAINFGVPLIPHAISSVGLIVIDRFFITQILGLRETGLFTSGYQLGAILSLLTISFNNAFVPWLYEKLNKNDSKINRQIIKMTYAYFVIILLVSFLLLYLFPYIIDIFIGNKFHVINAFTHLIIFGFAFQGMFFMVTNYLYYAKKTYVQSLISIGIVLIKIPLSFYSITYYGLAGAAWSFFITYVLFFITTWFFSSRIYNMPWNLFTTN